MKVAVFFGGKTCEHSISLITGAQAMREISKVHKVIPVFIDTDGAFYTSEEYKKGLEALKKPHKVKRQQIHFRAASDYVYSDKGKRLARVDCALLCNHGLNGEDGSLQGLLELCGIPYTGSCVRASAVGMDKMMMKQVFTAAGLPVLPYLGVEYSFYKENIFAVTSEIKALLNFPLIVKPANLGSSIGISIARDFESLYKSIDTAFEWDNRIVIENALEDFTELNCAVLGSGADLTTSQIEQPVGWKEFLTFDDKYVKKTEGNGKVFPADIDEELKERVFSSAKKAFSALGCSGVARVDFLLKDGQLFVNEINTIPGALSNYLFSYRGALSFTALIDRLLDIAINEKKQKDRIKYTYRPSFEIGGGAKQRKKL